MTDSAQSEQDVAGVMNADLTNAHVCEYQSLSSPKAAKPFYLSGQKKGSHRCRAATQMVGPLGIHDDAHRSRRSPRPAYIGAASMPACVCGSTPSHGVGLTRCIVLTGSIDAGRDFPVCWRRPWLLSCKSPRDQWSSQSLIAIRKGRKLRLGPHWIGGRQRVITQYRFPRTASRCRSIGWSVQAALCLLRSGYFGILRAVAPRRDHVEQTFRA